MITVIGNHKTQCGDIMNGVDALMGGEQADILYSDPPWGDGNLKYWATINRKMTGQEIQAAPLSAFLDSLFGIASRYCRRWLLVEYGVRWADMIEARGRAAGFTPLARIDVQYRAGSKMLPLHLHVFSRGEALPAGYEAAVAGTSGFATVTAAIGQLASPGQTILDPCCGMGYTAQAAIKLGLAFRGNELNAARLEKTHARLRRG